MPYIIAVIIIAIATAGYFALRTPAEAPSPEMPETPAAPAPGETPPGFVEPTTPPPPVPDDTTTSEATTPEASAANEPSVETIMEEVAATGVSGTYVAEASYLTPRRTNHDIEVSLTLEDNVVTAAEVLYDGESNASTPNHSSFDAAYESEVIGKSLDEISLSRVGGASLTSNAFNEAVAEIRAQT